jgi:hypothetical protein
MTKCSSQLFRLTMITLNRSIRRLSFVPQMIPSTSNTIFSELFFTTLRRKTHCVAVSENALGNSQLQREKNARQKDGLTQSQSLKKQNLYFCLFIDNITLRKYYYLCTKIKLLLFLDNRTFLRYWASFSLELLGRLVKRPKCLEGGGGAHWSFLPNNAGCLSQWENF